MIDTKNYNKGNNIKSSVVFIVCILISIVCLIPIYILAVNATRDSISITRGISFIPGLEFFNNYKNLMSKQVFQPFIGMRNSAIISVSATILSVFFSTLTAYGLIVYDFKFKGIAYSFILGVLMIPAQVSGVGFLDMMNKFGLYDSFIPLIIPAIAAPATVFFMRQYMKSSFPLEIVEAARIDGSNELRTFITIGIPMVKPAVAVQCIFAFIFQWNNFFTPSMLIVSDTKKTLPMMVRNLSSDRLATDYGIVYAGIAMSIVPLIVVYLFLSKYIIAGVSLGGVKE